MGGKKKNKTKKTKSTKLKTITPGMSMQEKAKVRHHNFKTTGVQTFGGTRKSYSKREAEKIGAAVSADNAAGGTASFASVTRGAKDPRNRAPDNQNVKVGELKPEIKQFSESLGNDYSMFAGPSINYNYSQRPKSDISFSDAVRAGARFNDAGRNELGGGQKVASSLSGGTGGGHYHETRSGAFVGTQQAESMITNPEKFRMSPADVRYLRESMGLPRAEAETETTDSSLVASNNLQNLAPKTVGGSEEGFDRASFNRALEGNYDPDSAGGLNIGGNFGLSAAESDRLGRVFQQTPSPRMLSEGGDLQISDMFQADTPGATLSKGINTVKNNIPILNMLPDLKINSVAEEAQRRYLGFNPNLPASVLKQQGRGGGGTRLPMTPTVAQEISPQTQPVPSASTTPTTQTGVDPNRLLQIQQQAYAQAYNPMLIGGFNPDFRFGAATPTIDYSTYFNY